MFGRFKKQENTKIDDLINIEETPIIEQEKEVIIYPALLPTGATYKIIDGNKDVRITKTSTVKECKDGDVISYRIRIVNVGEDFKLENKTIGVNDPCPCGSGKKYKKCCKNKEFKFYFATLSENEVFEDINGNTFNEVCVEKLNKGDSVNLTYKVLL